MLIYHITTKQAWEAAQQAGSYTADTLTTEGFIHFSDENQVERTANRYYRGQPNLILLQVETDLLTETLRYEEGEPGEKFPHLYGPLNLQAVTDVRELTPNPDGTLTMPDFSASA